MKSFAPMSKEELCLRGKLMPSGCWEWPGPYQRGGYGCFRRQKKMHSVHRVAAKFWIKKDLKSWEHVCHRCDNPACFNPDHLFIGNAKLNAKDKVMKGRQMFGRKIPNARLSDEIVKEIFFMREHYGTTMQKIADIYGVNYRTINNVLKRRTWKHVNINN